MSYTYQRRIKIFTKFIRKNLKNTQNLRKMKNRWKKSENLIRDFKKFKKNKRIVHKYLRKNIKL